jgi:parallel beta-helix repeat protein
MEEKMRILMIAILSVFALNLSATIINIPADQPTIQAGINVSVDADTVLVQPGTYLENINYNGKNITVASLFLTTQNTIYISQTVIDGNQNGSVVTFENEENSEAVLCGFTITNGYAQGNSNYYEDCGGGIFCSYYTNPIIENVIIAWNTACDSGGGIFCNEGGATLRNVTIHNNFAYYGGGISSGYGGGYPSDISLANVTIKNNSATYGGGIYWGGFELYFSYSNRCNIFSNTSPSLGKEIYRTYAYSHVVDVYVDTFSVYYPTETHAYPIENFSFHIQHVYGYNQINADLYVAVDGSNSNSGLTPNDPLRTIQCAINTIYADSLQPHSIYISAGVYSSSTNYESFPIQTNYATNYVSIIGAEDGETILDANHQNRIFTINNLDESTIKNLIIINGASSNGGGIFLSNSSPTFEKISITNNYATDYGGGVYCVKSSNPVFINTTISENSADLSGGGIYCSYSSSTLQNCILWNDSPDEIDFSDGSVIITYSDIQGGWEGEGNIDADPLFVDPEIGDYHLTENSPCIDAGDPNFPFDPDGTISDMGAFYYNQLNSINESEIQFVEYHLSNFPNPFNPTTTIKFSIQNDSKVKFTISNIKGQKIKTLTNEELNAGDHSIIWNGVDNFGNSVSSGVYMYKLNVNGKTEAVKKCLLLK